MNTEFIPMTASMHLKNRFDETAQALHRVRPNVTIADVNRIKDAMTALSSIVIFSAALTVLDELREAV